MAIDILVVQAPDFRVWDVIPPTAHERVAAAGGFPRSGKMVIELDTAFQGARVICRGPRSGVGGFASIFEGAPVTFRTSGDTSPFFETTERVRGFGITDLPDDWAEVSLLLA